MPVSTPSIFERYVITSTLSEGAGVTVENGRDIHGHRDVVIKAICLPNRDQRRHARRRAEDLMTEDHPNMIQIEAVCELGDILVLVMERVNGLPMTEWLADSPSADAIAAALEAVQDCAGALGLRSLATDDVLVTDDGEVRLLVANVSELLAAPVELSRAS